MSLIEEALRRQQEQERQRTPPEAHAVAPGTPPPLPPLPATVAAPVQAAEELSGGKKSAQPLLALIGVLALVVLAAGLLWWFLAQSLPALSARGRSARAETPRKMTNQTDVAHPPRVASTGTSTVPHAAVAVTSPAAPVFPFPNTATNTTAATNIAVVVVPLNPPPAVDMTSIVAVVSNPAPHPKPATPVPAEPWPKFTLKGRVAFGNSYALMLGNGQILEVGDSTANGIQLVSATQDRVRLMYKGQTRDYRLQAGTFVLLPPPDAEPTAE